MYIKTIWGNKGPCEDYWQFDGGVVATINGKEVVIEVEDTSCGDFGDRIFISVFDGEHLWMFNDGTMDDGSIDIEYAEEMYNSISSILDIDFIENIEDILRSVSFVAYHCV